MRTRPIIIIYYVHPCWWSLDWQTGKLMIAFQGIQMIVLGLRTKRGQAALLCFVDWHAQQNMRDAVGWWPIRVLICNKLLNLSATTFWLSCCKGYIACAQDWLWSHASGAPVKTASGRCRDQGPVHTGSSNSESPSELASPNNLAGWMM